MKAGDLDRMGKAKLRYDGKGWKKAEEDCNRVEKAGEGWAGEGLGRSEEGIQGQD